MLCAKCKCEISNDSVYCKFCGKKQQKEIAPKPLRRANGQGTVYKLSGRRKRPWAAAVNKTVIGYYADKTDAMRALEAAMTNGIPDGYNETVKDIYERWKDVHFRNLTESGKTGYTNSWDKLKPIHDRKMRTIKVADFQDIVDNAFMKSKNGEPPRPLSRSSKEKIKQLCSQLCKQAIKDDILLRNYGEFVTLEHENKKEKEIFTKSEIEELYKDNSETAKIILTLIYTGFRINELFTIKHADVNIDENYITGGEKTDAGKNRIVPISQKIKPFVLEWYNQNNAYLLTTGSGTIMNVGNFRSRDYYPLLEKLNIPKKSPHCTRHTFASLMAVAGARPEDLQKIIGHANYSTTAEIYIHADVEQLQKSIDLI
ncbi:MAG: site-specific integrase [Christensenella sp.]